jgi:hypothetical protein
VWAYSRAAGQQCPAVFIGRRRPSLSHRNGLNSRLTGVMCETFSLTTRPKQMHLKNLININRRIAVGLRGRR